MKGFYTTLIDRERCAREVDGIFRSNAGATAEKLAEWLEPELQPGETLPDIELLQRLMQRALARRWQDLSDSGESLLRERQEAQERQEEAVQATREARSQLVDLRNAFKGFFGARPAADFLGLRGATSRDPVVLKKQVKRAATRLQDADRELPAARLAMGDLDRQQIALPIQKHADRLSTTQTRLTSARKGVDAALFFKDRAVEDYDQTFVRVTSWFEDLYRLVGFEPLARAVRPSGHRKGRTFLDVQRRRKKPRQKPVSVPPSQQRVDETPSTSPRPTANEARPLEIVPAINREPADLEVSLVPSAPPRRFRPLRRALRLLRGSG